MSPAKLFDHGWAAAKAMRFEEADGFSNGNIERKEKATRVSGMEGAAAVRKSLAPEDVVVTFGTTVTARRCQRENEPSRCKPMSAEVK